VHRLAFSSQRGMQDTEGPRLTGRGPSCSGGYWLDPTASGSSRSSAAACCWCPRRSSRSSAGSSLCLAIPMFQCPPRDIREPGCPAEAAGAVRAAEHPPLHPPPLPARPLTANGASAPPARYRKSSAFSTPRNEAPVLLPPGRVHRATGALPHVRISSMRRRRCSAPALLLHVHLHTSKPATP
jgi:hypothetical protein